MKQNANTKSLKERGFCVLRKVYSESAIKEIRSAVLNSIKILCRYYGIPEPMDSWDSIHDASVELKTKNEEAYLNALRIAQNDPNVLQAANQARLINFLKSAGLSNPVVSLKPFLVLIAPDLFVEGGYNLRPFHQEWPVMQGSTDAVVAWTAMHDITENHNALELIPGSHLLGLRNYEITACGTSVLNQEMPREKPIRIELNAGDTVIFSAFTVHRTSEQGREYRAALTVRYNNLAEDSFINRNFSEPYRLEIDRNPETVYRPRMKNLKK